MCAYLLSHLLLLYIGRVHGAISGCTVLCEVHPVSAQNKSLISDTAYIPPERKPIPFSLHGGYEPKRDHFELPIPKCWYPKSLMDPTQSLTDPTQASGI